MFTGLGVLHATAEPQSGNLGGPATVQSLSSPLYHRGDMLCALMQCIKPLPLYCLQIGDYLLTLPQQLEPFMSHDNPALASALKTGKLPALDHGESF